MASSQARSLVAIFTLFALLCADIFAYSTGSGTCDATAAAISAGMGGPTSTGTGGFSIVVPAQYEPTVGFTVRIQGSSQFNGFLIYAVNAQGARVGTFGTAGGAAKPYSCSGDPGSTSTQTGATPKGPTFDLTYTCNEQTTLTFHAAIVKASLSDWYILSSTSSVASGPPPSPKCSNWVWNQVMPAGGGALPPPRAYGLLVWDQSRSQLVLFGGSGGGGVLADTWVFAAATLTWTEIATGAAAKPSARSGFVGGIDAAGNSLYITSGGTASGDTADTWALDLLTNTWAAVTPSTSALPPIRHLGSGGIPPTTAAASSRVLLLFGGFNGGSGGGRLQDSWSLNLLTRAWTDITPSGKKPLNRCYQSQAVLTADASVMFGGCASGFGPCPLDDGWSFTRATSTSPWTWTEFSAQGAQGEGPSARRGNALVAVPAGGASAAGFAETTGANPVAGAGMALLFGGTGPFNDVWITRPTPSSASATAPTDWEFVQARVLASASPPAARGGPMAAWVNGSSSQRLPSAAGSNSLFGQMVVFGGGSLNDLWTLSPSADTNCTGTVLGVDSRVPTSSAADDVLKVSGYKFNSILKAGGKSVMGVGWTVSPDGLSVTFEAKAATTGWISLGFPATATSGAMVGADAVIAWAPPGGTGQTVKGYGLPSKMLAQIAAAEKPASYLSGASVSDSNGITTLTFTRTAAAPAAGDVAIAVDGPTHLLFAIGTTDSLSTHTERGSVSINLASGVASNTPLVAVWYPRFAVVLATLAFLILCAALLRHTALGRTPVARALLQRSLAAPLPWQSWWRSRPGSALDLNLVASFLQLKWAEAVTALLYFASVVVVAALSGEPFASFGWASVMLLMTASLPVYRGSLWVSLAGLPFERALKYHRIIGRVAFLAVLAHFIAILPRGHSLLSTEPAGPQSVLPLFGLLAALSLLLMLSLAHPWVRRAHFEWFRYPHAILAPLLFTFACLHIPGSWPYLALPYGSYVADYLISLCRRHAATVTVRKAVALPGAGNGSDSGGIHLEVETRALGSRGPGDYAFLRCPTIGGHLGTQWHPFTISSSPTDPLLSFHIKDMGAGTFTHALCATAAEHGTDTEIQLHGPQGQLSIALDAYKTIVLVAGGIGITPMASILSFLHATAGKGTGPFSRLSAIHLVWAVRTPSALQWMRPLLNAVAANPRIHCHLFVTRPDDAAAAGDGAEEEPLPMAAHNGRPDLQQLLQQALEGTVPSAPDAAAAAAGGGGGEVRAAESQQQRCTPEEMGVCVCGPPALVVGAQRAAHMVGVDCHAETFFF